MVSFKSLPEEELFLAGSTACQGCPASLALRIAFKALGSNTILLVVASCTSVLQGSYPHSAINLPLMNAAFATGGATASGVVAGIKALVKRGELEEEPTVLMWAGDGGTYDIGIQALSGAAERETDFIYVCYNNEMYSNTGTQRSGATPIGAWTTTTPGGKVQHRKDIAQIMIAHRIPYVATASLAYPLDFYQKMLKAREIRGTKYIELLAPCPPGWKFPSSKMIEVSRMAVQCGMWLLYEHEDGENRFTGATKRMIEGKVKKKPVVDYLEVQGRFKQVLASPEGKEAERMLEEDVSESIRRLHGWVPEYI
ncbi:MAG: pyruvate synthase subunit beta [Actinobacteria bacterium]|nr:pyruvate synthase subunit beta [Actinomycetota bacterium]MCG2817855.1 thiamine pyrophosphate-dependent enzyme [Actinomycetes bacterium]MBU4179285.1 pyruvate synthase subunit beta [Actinomycetota bacterium]MBU4217741.1 pyruvate synthase subunit beta [Actinomycetota bacterium]MBU4358946.1 pyruvate synthase subunit beta [Actinomycetota bacterium]